MLYSSLIMSLLSAIPVAKAAVIPAFGSEAVAHSLSSGDSRIYYSGTDGSIHELFGPPKTDGSKPYDWVLLPPGTAMPNTPLATIKQSGSSGYQAIWLYFIDADGTKLREQYWSSGVGWVEGQLSSSGFKVAPGSKALYALGGDGSSSTHRVGWTCAGGMSLCEAYYDGSWHVKYY